MVSYNEDFNKRIALHNIIKKYENYFSVIKIKNDMSVKNCLSSDNTLPSARQVTSSKVNIALKSVNTEKVSLANKIQRFVKLASSFPTTLLGPRP